MFYVFILNFNLTYAQAPVSKFLELAAWQNCSQVLHSLDWSWGGRRQQGGHSARGRSGRRRQRRWRWSSPSEQRGSWSQAPQQLSSSTLEVSQKYLHQKPGTIILSKILFHSNFLCWQRQKRSNLLTGISVALRTGTVLLLFPRFKFIPTPGMFRLATPGRLRLTLMFCCWCWCVVDVVEEEKVGWGWWPDILPDIAWYARKLWKPKHEFRT